MRLGACGYIRNPFDDNDVKAPVSRALHYRPTTSRYDTDAACAAPNSRSRSNKRMMAEPYTTGQRG